MPALVVMAPHFTLKLSYFMMAPNGKYRASYCLNEKCRLAV